MEIMIDIETLSSANDAAYSDSASLFITSA